MLNQIRMVDARRLQRRLAVLDSGDFSAVKEKLQILLELSHNHPPSAESVGNPKNIDSLADEPKASQPVL